jgi:hypothetical protein
MILWKRIVGDSVEKISRFYKALLGKKGRLIQLKGSGAAPRKNGTKAG